jgi:lipopolysaccharide biosynthesis protein
VADPLDLRFLAFYLPQFHPIPENDAWWEPGFTEWTNVVRGRPLFEGHDQPHVPADLGFYDLRLPEVRADQAAMAAAYGITGFCYYHYWFGGRQLLQRPFDEVLESGEPDFPFALCWANESWTRVWDGGESDVLVQQTYSNDDDRAHMQWFANAFADHRYITVDGRPILLVYRPGVLPDARRTADTWRDEATRLGLPEPYLCAVEAFKKEVRTPADLGFDAAVQFVPDLSNLGPRLRQPGLVGRAARQLLRPRHPYRIHQIYRYDDAVERDLAAPAPPYKRYPCVTPGWDNTVRRKTGGRVLAGSTPDLYERWVNGVVDHFEPYSADENLVFVNAWNEWAEGNHLEPCERWGRAYLDAHARAAGARGRRVVS